MSDDDTLGDARSRVVSALLGWGAADLLWLAGELESGSVAPPAICDGPTSCHGSMVDCEACGDVRLACDDDDCDRHRCHGCGVITSELVGGEAWCEDCLAVVGSEGGHHPSEEHEAKP